MPPMRSKPARSLACWSRARSVRPSGEPEGQVGAQVVEGSGHQHPVAHRLGLGDGLAQGVARLAVAAGQLAQRRGPLDERLGPHALGARRRRPRRWPARPSRRPPRGGSAACGAGPARPWCRARSSPGGSSSTSASSSATARPQLVDAVHLVVDAGQHAGRRRPLAGGARPGHAVPVLDVGQRLVVEAEQPRRPRRHRQQLGVVGRLARGRRRPAAAPGGSTRRPGSDATPCAGQGHELVVAAGAARRGGRGRRGPRTATGAAPAAPPRAAAAAPGRAAAARPRRARGRGGR